MLHIMTRYHILHLAQCWDRLGWSIFVFLFLYLLPRNYWKLDIFVCQVMVNQSSLGKVLFYYRIYHLNRGCTCRIVSN